MTKGALDRVDVDEVRTFLSENHRAVLATRRSDGGIQLSPVLVGIDGEGRAVISVTEARAKTKNLRRDPRASLCVMSDRFFGRWVQIDGTARIVSLPEAMEPLVDYFRRVAGKEHDNWDEYRQAMLAEGRCLVRIDLERATP